MAGLNGQKNKGNINNDRNNYPYHYCLEAKLETRAYSPGPTPYPPFLTGELLRRVDI